MSAPYSGGIRWGARMGRRRRRGPVFDVRDSLLDDAPEEQPRGATLGGGLSPYANSKMAIT